MVAIRVGKYLGLGAIKHSMIGIGKHKIPDNLISGVIKSMGLM